MSAPVVALVPVLALVALLLLGYREICLRVGRLAARILLLPSHPAASANNPAYSLPAVHLLQTMLCLAVTVFQLANNELRAAACYLLLVKAALIRRPAAWLPHGLVDLLSIASLTWLAFGHRPAGRFGGDVNSFAGSGHARSVGVVAGRRCRFLPTGLPLFDRLGDVSKCSVGL